MARRGSVGRSLGERDGTQTWRGKGRRSGGSLRVSKNRRTSGTVSGIRLAPVPLFALRLVSSAARHREVGVGQDDVTMLGVPLAHLTVVQRGRPFVSSKLPRSPSARPLPRAWTHDEDCRDEAGIPVATRFAMKIATM